MEDRCLPEEKAPETGTLSSTEPFYSALSTAATRPRNGHILAKPTAAYGTTPKIRFNLEWSHWSNRRDPLPGQHPRWTKGADTEMSGTRWGGAATWAAGRMQGPGERTGPRWVQARSGTGPAGIPGPLGYQARPDTRPARIPGPLGYRTVRVPGPPGYQTRPDTRPAGIPDRSGTRPARVPGSLGYWARWGTGRCKVDGVR